MGWITSQLLASHAVRDAVRAGEMPPARSHPCVDCGAPARGYHHINGYAKKDHLVVEPLCLKCHATRSHPSHLVRYHDDGSEDTIPVRSRKRGVLPLGVTA